MSVLIAPTVSPSSTVADRAWIAGELEKGMESERTFSCEAKSRGDAPPDPTLGVLYFEIAAADQRHIAIIERVATRYGHTPGSAAGSGIGNALGQMKDRFSKLGSSPIDQLATDLQAKSWSVQWLTAWVQTLERIGDSASARDLSAVLKDDQAHQDALQQGLNRMIEQNARGKVEE